MSLSSTLCSTVWWLYLQWTECWLHSSQHWSYHNCDHFPSPGLNSKKKKIPSHLSPSCLIGYWLPHPNRSRPNISHFTPLTTILNIIRHNKQAPPKKNKNLPTPLSSWASIQTQQSPQHLTLPNTTWPKHQMVNISCWAERWWANQKFVLPFAAWSKQIGMGPIHVVGILNWMIAQMG